MIAQKNQSIGEIEWHSSSSIGDFLTTEKSIPRILRHRPLKRVTKYMLGRRPQHSPSCRHIGAQYILNPSLSTTTRTSTCSQAPTFEALRQGVFTCHLMRSCPTFSRQATDAVYISCMHVVFKIVYIRVSTRLKT